ncbi:ATP phosphoribosyltransferase regulatory subunit [Prochlorococcus marinus]|uniref:ATP phosphoribosyltransferase regulatory subunit n=1 Tax=Prochlorococcus marinus (strain MIT 9211) TaxID=93059 RepID=HISZ_PROM4|nr:ATP phosphoribosyltransferase regulatory subunit [Prochlorococcus marinus]A9BAD0.1 RecName: Full=ATP phosphoribosyltransferase regulatory subunit [Prochlorococcus marinus str. MIT 9211]ABX08792.1 possible Histidyl-tRNA synthetase [Prochlorococcus marinus str. MIT 9211]
MAKQSTLGSKELNPRQVEENNLLATKLSEIYKKWGYQEVAPPQVEGLKTLMAGGGIDSKEILKLVIDEPVGLRPEMTASIARAASTRYVAEPRPLRLWASGTIFKSREESDGKIVIDESLQSGVELFGIEGMEIEVELLYLLIESLKKLNIDESSMPILLINHISLMELIISKFSKSSKEKVTDILSNFDLIEIEKLELDFDERNTLKLLQELRGSPRNVIKTLESLYGNNKILDSLTKIFNIIEPISNKYNIQLQLDPTFKPHYELYTGIVFELVCNTRETPVVIARGGRYDELVKMFNENPEDEIAAGFSYSIDKIRELNTRLETFDTNPERILVAYGPNKTIKDAIECQAKLHEKGYVAIIELNSCINEDHAMKLVNQRKCTKLKWINS